VLSQGDPFPDVKNQVPPVTVTAIQADQPQHSPIIPKTDARQQTKDKSNEDHLQAPKEAQDASFYNQRSTDKVYVMVQPMPAPQSPGTPHFTG